MEKRTSPSIVIPPSTPPHGSSYTSATCTTSPTSFTPPTPPHSTTDGAYFSPRTPSAPTHEPLIVMGGRVSRPSSPDAPEKSMSIEVPAIVLTEPPAYTSLVSSPSGKSHILLPAVLLPIPPSYPSDPSYGPAQLYSQTFASSFLTNRPQSSNWTTTLRTLLLLAVLALGAWHLYASMCFEQWEATL